MTKIKLTAAQLAQIAHLFTPPSDDAPWMVIAQIFESGTGTALQITGERAINVSAAMAGLAKPSKLNRARILAEWKKKNGGE